MSKVLVFADKEDDRLPEIAIEVVLDSRSDSLCLTDIDSLLPRLGVDACQEIDTRLGGLVSLENQVQLRPRPSHRLAAPV
jgi:hypothetical protein